MHFDFFFPYASSKYDTKKPYLWLITFPQSQGNWQTNSDFIKNDDEISFCLSLVHNGNSSQFCRWNRFFCLPYKVSQAKMKLR